MTHALYHTVLCMLLALVYFVDCGTLCIDNCSDRGFVGVAEVSGHRADDGDHHESSAADHCECHCMCACHIPALLAQAPQGPPVAVSEIPRGVYVPSFPTTPVSPPDHIPLV